MKRKYVKPEMKEIPEIWKVYKQSKTRVWEVSNYGRVRKNGIIVEPTNYNRKYLCIGGFNIHRAVAELFIPNPENKPCVDHIDTNRFNNCWYNLRWVTPKENCNNPLTLSKMSKVRIGIQYDDEYKKNMSEICKNISHTEEWNRNVSKSLIGYVWINNGHINKHANSCNLDYYLNNGWVKGLLNRRWINR